MKETPSYSSPKVVREDAFVKMVKHTQENVAMAH